MKQWYRILVFGSSTLLHLTFMKAYLCFVVFRSTAIWANHIGLFGVLWLDLNQMIKNFGFGYNSKILRKWITIWAMLKFVRTQTRGSDIVRRQVSPVPIVAIFVNFAWDRNFAFLIPIIGDWIPLIKEKYSHFPSLQ